MPACTPIASASLVPNAVMIKQPKGFSPVFDFVCEQDRGCDPVPFSREMFGALQRTDPRCKNRAPVSEADAQALKQLGELVKSLTGAAKSN